MPIGGLRPPLTNALSRSALYCIRLLESKPSLKKILTIEECQYCIPCRRDFDPPSIGEAMVAELRKRGYGIILIVHHFQEIPWTTFFDVGTKIGLSPDSLPRSYVETMLAFSADPKKRRREWEKLRKKMLVLHDGELTVHGKPKPFGDAGTSSARRRFLHRFCVSCLCRRLRKLRVVWKSPLKTVTPKVVEAKDAVICCRCGKVVNLYDTLVTDDGCLCPDCICEELKDGDSTRYVA